LTQSASVYSRVASYAMKSLARHLRVQHVRRQMRITVENRRKSNEEVIATTTLARRYRYSSGNRRGYSMGDSAVGVIINAYITTQQSDRLIGVTR